MKHTVSLEKQSFDNKNELFLYMKYWCELKLFKSKKNLTETWFYMNWTAQF